MTAAPAETLLRWYDRHARVLPWRTDHPDPYRVWLSEIMLQQTTTTAVTPYYARFLERWPTVEALARAPDSEVMGAWAGLGYYARARNLLACARRVVTEHGGRFPVNETGLRTLPGIGAYTAAAIAAIAFGARAVVVDGNVERVISRLFAIDTPLPASRPTIRSFADAMTPNKRAGDFAQAMMDLGATICTPTRPACILCPLRDNCVARRRGEQDTLPRKAPKAVRPARIGIVFVGVRADRSVLVRTRPARGLLGGMTEFPGLWPLDKDAELVDWTAHSPFEADWRTAGEALHGFTHFDLALKIYRADLSKHTAALEPFRWALPENEAFPTLMRKVAGAAGVFRAFQSNDARAPEQAPPQDRGGRQSQEQPLLRLQARG